MNAGCQTPFERHQPHHRSSYSVEGYSPNLRARVQSRLTHYHVSNAISETMAEKYVLNDLI